VCLKALQLNSYLLQWYSVYLSRAIPRLKGGMRGWRGVTELVHRGSRHSCHDCLGALFGCLVLLLLCLLLGRHSDVVKIDLHTHTSHRHLVKINLHTCLQVTDRGACK